MKRRNTKIIATLGPASRSPDTLVRMAKAGMDVARLNFSHGTHEQHGSFIEGIREVEKKLERKIGVLVDLQGPEIRIEGLQAPRELRRGELLTLAAKKNRNIPGAVGLSKDVSGSVSKGEILFLDDGMIRLQVRRIEGSAITCAVLNSGILAPRKRLNIPNPPSGSFLSKKDREDIAFAREHDADYLALSYVSGKKDVESARKISGNALLVSKIETEQAVDRIDELIEASDAIMVARGDLGIQIPMEKLPIVQHAVVKKCNSKGKPVIVATHMLNSMTENPLPTRAEVNDVTTAVIMGADAVMLSAESAVGAYPVESVQTMEKIITHTESEVDISHVADAKIEVVTTMQIMSKSLALFAYHRKPRAIAIITNDSSLAQMLSRYRLGIPIYVFTSSPKVMRDLFLYWGIFSFHTAIPPNYEALVSRVMDRMRKNQLAQKGDDVILIINEAGDERMHNIMDIRKME